MRTDVDRDGRIDGADADCQLAGTQFRFWYNADTDKGDYVGQLSDVRPNWEQDPLLATVKGKLDLVNLFPVFIDVSEFRQAWGSAATFHLRCSSGNLRYCSLSDVTSALACTIQTSPVQTSDRESLESAVLHSLDYGGTNLTEVLTSGRPTMMLAFMAGGPVEAGCGPEIVVSLGDAEVFRYRLPLQITSVDEMYRFGDLRPAAENPWFTPTVPGMPPNLPDGGRGVDVFFTHGFNVSEPDARKWGRILFKRFWLSGFNARLHMLTWEGNYSWTGNWANGLHYQHDAWYAQRTAGALRRYVEAAQPDSSKRILMTQSLGNMVACEALREGLQVGKYFMFDAAVPSEAVDGTLQDADTATRMKYVPSTWQDYANACWAANWFKWFKDDPNDARGKIGWPNRFASALANATEVYNYYSSGDDVFKELATVPSMLDGVTESLEMYCWQKQETLKGASVAAGTAYGGWGFHEWVSGFNPDNYVPTNAHYTVEQADAMVADGSVTNTPVFNRGFEPMFDRNAALDDQRLALAKYVPAVSSAVGGMEVSAIRNNTNMNLNDEDGGVPRPNRWGRGSPDWHHSDMKDMAYFYVYKLYEQLIQKGNLK